MKKNPKTTTKKTKPKHRTHEGNECLPSGHGTHPPMELHLLLSCKRDTQANKRQGYGEITDLQIPKFELLFRFCVNIYYFKNHY